MTPVDEPVPIPEVLVKAWGLHPPPGKGPRPVLSLELIVSTAIGMAARTGLRRVSMTRVAATLGVSPMALYRYLSSRDDLLLLMADAALGPPGGGPLPGETWRQGLTRWAGGQRQRLLAHPWLVTVPLNLPPLTPNLVGWMEDGLAMLAGTGLHPGEKLPVVLQITGLVRNQTTLILGLAAVPPGRSAPMSSAQNGELLRRLAGPADFPRLHEVLAAGAFEADPDTPFGFGLDRLLDGVDALIRARSAG